MTYKEAQKELKKVLSKQKTVTVPKLKRILMSMNISLKKESVDEDYLREEIKRLRKQNKRLQRRLSEKGRKACK
ncbi:hypothetical protein P4637_03290 [Halalkalibacterium halodurans]|uniref:hypothetical protein n=1 Tax=Halalkalibacterium halodurans TaxID=86665 RepID=UPI002E230C68|nr:hypothetical protein [Halalkalibacterium halodurans]MED4105523.1 hypothetical protein [Halalkalibacterium halodurans]MED4109271.1 hypothetical protein [Halalkalibacterium halodurans]MED4149715.1 hypothetical protein [Halalkalibacterium halodurans]